jgi:SSS family solute:Na+ symporter
MSALGLHIVDWLVIVVYFIGMIGVGLWARRRIRDTQDFYQGSRSFGRTIMAFLNFGNITDAGQTAGVTSEIFRQGLQGVWFQNLVLFHTPFQWFIAALQRRARYLAPGDMYLHRFESRFLAGLYAGVLIPVAIYANSFGYLLTGKTLQAMMIKPATEYTSADSAMVRGFGELKSLRTLDYASLTPAQRTTLSTLEEREKRGELRAFISYLDLPTFYIVYAILIALYTALGGLLAVAVIDIVQGVLIVFLSLALLPAALAHIGGLAGLRAAVPHGMFELFGSSAVSDYTWYSVAALALLNLVVNAPKGFMIGGAARDDRAARIGFVTGSVFKRFMMVAWALTGLLALGLYAGKVSDPTNIWGFMTRDLLGVGAVGLMIAAVFSANMDGNSTISLESSAAVIKNIVEPLLGSRFREAQQVVVGRVLLVLILGVSVYFAHQMGNESIMVVFRYILSVGTIVGPSIWLAYFWRRLNTRAVAVQMLLSIALVVVVPNVVPKIPALATSPSLTVQTTERFVDAQIEATQEDVSSGRATTTGELITKRERIAPAAIYFETVAREKPEDTTSRYVGRGVFRPEIWMLAQIGVDFRDWGKAGLTTAISVFDATLPFVILIAVSLFTRRNSEDVLREFYARVHTAAVADPELDAALVREKFEHPELVERDKVFPGSDWEFWRPTWFDIGGFLACVAFVLVIIGLYIMVASIGG